MLISRYRAKGSHLPFLLLAAIGLALASQFEIPIEPVPVTLQSLAVVLIGFWLGPVAGFAATVVWLAGGALGLPVLAGGKGGVEHFSGPTAGYLFAFPIAAATAGYFGVPQDRPPRIFRLVLAAVAAHALILIVGGCWLAMQFGLSLALAKGVVPFIPGSLLKSAVAAAIYAIARRTTQPSGQG